MEGLTDEDDDIDPHVEEEENPDAAPEITLHALTGWDSPHTLRIKAHIQKKDMVVLIDSGSTHNFICEKAARHLNLSCTPMTPFTVRVANGSPLRCKGRYEAVPVVMEGVTFPITLYALPLVGLDVVLGIEWLEGLGPILCDWKAHWMQFVWAGETTTLHGLNYKSIQADGPTELVKHAHTNGSLCDSSHIARRHFFVIPHKSYHTDSLVHFEWKLALVLLHISLHFQKVPVSIMFSMFHCLKNGSARTNQHQANYLHCETTALFTCPHRKF